MGKRKAGNIRGFASTGHYLQGPGVIRELPQITAELGTTALVLIDGYFYDTLSAELSVLFRTETPELNVQFRKAGTECSWEQIHRLIADCGGLFREAPAAEPSPAEQGAAGQNAVGQSVAGQCAAEASAAPAGRPIPDMTDMEQKAAITNRSRLPEVLIGIGGGKTMDTVRGAAKETGAAIIEIPTSASTNAATSCLAVVYDEQHVGKAAFLKKNPEYVLADTDILVKAPARMLAAGIGDALATWFEARSCWSDNNVNYACGGRKPTICGKTVARACLDTLLSEGRAAFRAARQGLRTEAFEDTVEAIMLLSGIGWENNGTSIAHALVEGVPTIEDTASRLHGECVAFCVLVQMIMDRDSEADFRRVYDFCRDLGLPVSLEELGIRTEKERKVRAMIAAAFAIDPGITIANYYIDEETIYQAVMYLDGLSSILPDFGEQPSLA